MNEQLKSTVSTTESESTVAEVPALVKLISTMLPTADSFVPKSNVTNDQSNVASTIPISTMNNDAPPFIPSQHQYGNNQQHNVVGRWSGGETRANRRSHSGVSCRFENKINVMK